MAGKHETIWKQRPIRMSDELWCSLRKKALKENIPVAEFIRNILIKENNK